ncbi:APC family permease [Liquorilactobacillus nagelii]|uniref:APC family permease n=1 Tax=Liquorilactobacillus nagelii TaxID=82688 RepID=UPI0039E75845
MEKINRSSHLKKNSVSMLGALAMSAAFMGPAVSVFFNMVPAANAAGKAFPLSFLLSMIAILFISNSIMQYSKKVNGASFAFAYTSKGFGPNAGFMSGWILLFAYAMVSPITYAGFGVMLSEFLGRQFGIHISWWIFFVLIGLIVSCLSYFGVNNSTKTTMVFLFLELIMISVLFVSVIVHGHNSVEPFIVSSSTHGMSSIGLGMVYGILSFVGFEAAANLGEETKNANKNIPRAITISVILIGLLYVIGAYVADIAFNNNAAAIVSNGSPFDTIARNYWGNNLAWLINLTALNSVFANAVAGQTSIVRNLFSLGRAKILPRTISYTNRNGVPVHAIIFDFILSMVLGSVVGIWLGGWGVWNLLGGMMSLGLIIVYGLVTISLPFFYKRRYPQEYSHIKHLLLPIIGTLLLLIPLYSSIWPIPEFPYNLAPYIIIVWIITGAIYLHQMKKKRADIVAQFGSTFKDEDS